MAYYTARANFGGVQVMSVDRGADPYLDATVRLTTMNLASSAARLRWQGDTEIALNDGATGIGLTVDAVRRLIAEYQQRFQRTIYFVDAAGRVVVFGNQLDRAADLRTDNIIGCVET